MITLLMTIAGFFRGIHEGMINIRFSEPMHNREFQEGVRGHKWHRYYHLIASIRDLSMLGLGIAFILMKWQYAGLLAGLILMWEFSEVGQALARVKYPVMFDKGLAYERVVFMDCGRWILRGKIVYLFHVIRIMLAFGIFYTS
ncbi:MAG: hypothetical protein Q7J65_04240 [Candidatus Marinimicrobia bacterium]|nr:hypothetical protein [Candidatus Neomarinimicrobiota bacterium]